ncbi:hypothetical protein OK015_15350 [Mycobacterium sp. Aquia_216]|nr:hypothetical protein [Mycobacterium sp. Aquia_216]WAJ42656.1 hypothetical protein OK015_15350 [Mycobacterium sp. Aquia_216]
MSIGTQGDDMRRTRFTRDSTAVLLIDHRVGLIAAPKGQAATASAR